MSAAAATSPCRICGGSVREFLDLGRQPLSDTFVDPEDTSGGFVYELRVGRCGDCTMVQLVEEVPREMMFTADYPFFTASSTRMVEHFTRTAQWLLDEHCCSEDPFVIEIGANDGTMLATIAGRGVRHLGVDPAGLPGEDATERGVVMLHDFFETRTAELIRTEHGLADVIFAANTLCHIPALDDVFAGIDAVLAPHGVVVFEDPSLSDVLRLTSFDQIYDEHFYVFSATSVARAARGWGLELVDVAALPVHGGELRYTLARSGTREATPAVAAVLEDEAALGVDDPATFDLFAERVRRHRDELVGELTRLREDGVRVAGYAATAKSATVLNYGGIGPELLPAIHDTTPQKQHRLAPGSRIPVLPFPDEADEPDVYLLLAWNHSEEIMAKERAFADRGGRWLVYVPEVRLI